LAATRRPGSLLQAFPWRATIWRKPIRLSGRCPPHPSI